MKKLKKFLARLLIIHNIIVIDAFEHNDNNNKGIDIEQAYYFTEAIQEMGINKKCLIFHATTRKATESARAITTIMGTYTSRRLAPRHELCKAHIDFTKSVYTECKQLIQLFNRHKSVIIITDGYAGIVGNAIANCYLTTQNNLDNEIPAGEMIIIKNGISTNSLGIYTYD